MSQSVTSCGFGTKNFLMCSGVVQHVHKTCLGAASTRVKLRSVRGSRSIPVVLHELRDMRVELVEPCLPERALLVEPRPGGGKRRRVEFAAAHATDLLAPDQPGLLELAEMRHERRQRHVVPLREFADGRRAAG